MFGLVCFTFAPPPFVCHLSWVTTKADAHKALFIRRRRRRRCWRWSLFNPMPKWIKFRKSVLVHTYIHNHISLTLYAILAVRWWLLFFSLSFFFVPRFVFLRQHIVFTPHVMFMIMFTIMRSFTVRCAAAVARNIFLAIFDVHAQAFTNTLHISKKVRKCHSTQAAKSAKCHRDSEGETENEIDGVGERKRAWERLNGLKWERVTSPLWTFCGTIISQRQSVDNPFFPVISMWTRDFPLNYGARDVVWINNLMGKMLAFAHCSNPKSTINRRRYYQMIFPKFHTNILRSMCVYANMATHKYRMGSCAYGMCDTVSVCVSAYLYGWMNSD